MAAGQVTFRTVVPKGLTAAQKKVYKHPGLSVTCWLGADPPTPTGGYGGWQIIDRPRRTGVTQWIGRQPIQMDVPIVLDGYKDNDSIEYDIVRLERMAQPYIKEPPVVRLFGVAIPHQDLDWVVANLGWGATLRDDRTGDRYRQEMTVSLISYVSVDKLQLSAAKKARAKKGRR